MCRPDGHRALVVGYLSCCFVAFPAKQTHANAGTPSSDTGRHVALRGYCPGCQASPCRGPGAWSFKAPLARIASISRSCLFLSFTELSAFATSFPRPSSHRKLVRNLKNEVSHVRWRWKDQSGGQASPEDRAPFSSHCQTSAHHNLWERFTHPEGLCEQSLGLLLIQRAADATSRAMSPQSNKAARLATKALASLKTLAKK